MNDLGFEAVTKTFGPLIVAKGIDLRVPDSKYVCLLGPSGCGKTTMLRMAAGLTAPDSGRIFIGERDVTDLEPGIRQIGLAFQNYALYPHHNVFDNLAFPMRCKARRKDYQESVIAAKVGQIAELLHIDGILQRAVNEISGGQKQRVALGRALICDPKILLLDEPITHLDVRLRYEMRLEIKRLHRSIGTTTLHITHDQQEAMALADLIVVMKGGEIQQIGTPDEVYYSPVNEFVATFIGDPPMSVLQARWSDEKIFIADKGMAVPDRIRSLLGRMQRSEIRIGLRSGAMHLAPPDTANLSGKVLSHEVAGRELDVAAETSAGVIRLRLPGDQSIHVDETVGVQVDFSQAFLFDASTGARIG